MLQLYANNKLIPTKMMEFSDGAITCKLDELPEDITHLNISVCPTTPVYRILEELSCVAAALFELMNARYFDNNFKINLNLPYLPYARADRVFEKGNPNGLHNFLRSLDDFGIDNVKCYDVHNMDSVYTFLNEYGVSYNFINIPQLRCFKNSLPLHFNIKYDIVLAPDKGSVGKAATIADHLDVEVFNCGKVRDISTGQIIKSTLPEGVDFKGKTVLIPDDLCDGGYTFIKLVELVKDAGAKQVDLYVTHMIGSKGLDSFKGLIDNIYCYQTVGNYLNKLDITKFNEEK